MPLRALISSNKALIFCSRSSICRRPSISSPSSSRLARPRASSRATFDRMRSKVWLSPPAALLRIRREVSCSRAPMLHDQQVSLGARFGKFHPCLLKASLWQARPMRENETIDLFCRSKRTRCGPDRMPQLQSLWSGNGFTLFLHLSPLNTFSANHTYYLTASQTSVK